MTKTAPPGGFELGDGDRLTLNAVPDTFDKRDFPYRPRLTLLSGTLSQQDIRECYVMKQSGESCVGHALAAVINIVLGQQRNAGGPSVRVSPYMLYRLARRYDEYSGERDEGSSLRGALKGWFHHGVSLLQDFPALNLDPEPDLNDPEFEKKCRDRPLGAFYRVNPYRLDDMQSALNELHAVVASCVIHDGWKNPELCEREGLHIHAIIRDIDSRPLGGHAFAIVGYNRVGFVVQNSWGPDWGERGFATLPYEDWLDSAYDAWVVRPGVPQTPLTGGRVRDAEATDGVLATGRGPDLRRLDVHVVNVGAAGRLSNNGPFVSTPGQIDRAFVRMKEWHDEWTDGSSKSVRHILLYAPGGAVKAGADLEVAQRHVNWWLNNHIYPIYFWWRTGAAETLLSDLDARLRGDMPADGIGFDLVEQFDRLVEMTARARFRWVWDELKENTKAACLPLAQNDASDIQWPPRSTDALTKMASLPAASLVVHRLAQYVSACGPKNVRIHLVGHGAGAVFIRALIERLLKARVTDESGGVGRATRPSRPLRIESLTFLAPALRVDDFKRVVLPQLGRKKRIRHFTTFAMTDVRETNDTCGIGPSPIYQKSFLYLISRGLERPGIEMENGGNVAFEVPLLGMAKYLQHPSIPGGRGTLEGEIRDAGGDCVMAPSAPAANERSDAESHARFDDDVATMTSVVMRMRGEQSVENVRAYVRNDTLETAGTATAPRETGEPTTGARRRKRPNVDAPTQTVATQAAGGPAPVTVDAASPTTKPPAPPAAAGWDAIPEAADNPQTGSPVKDMLRADGWKFAR